MLRAHYQADEADFVELLPEEDGKPFLTDLDARLQAADDSGSQRSAAGRSQQLGQQVQTIMRQLPLLLNRLEARLRRAEGLTVPLKAFGVKAVRDAVVAEDPERLELALKTLLQNLEANAAALQAKGHKAEETEQLRTLRQTLAAGSTAQDVAQTRQQGVTQENLQALSHLCQLMQELMADGKSLYRGVDKAKVKNYTLTQLLKRVRREREAKEEPAG
ncbi:hypothetical protein DLM85_20275 [Hymenobacter edaphi]|uniref:Uncharacterized protein n=1 Tax=Hymenobacter edaphi TaxID=2211146 RepID=A0A328BDF3_9BACT|nr:hypothetical protein DLM85_20275 [Hymenobacter edaphi]